MIFREDEISRAVPFGDGGKGGRRERPTAMATPCKRSDILSEDFVPLPGGEIVAVTIADSV